MTDAKLIREYLTDLKGWVDHWKDDRACGLPATELSLTLASSRIYQALVVLDRIEKEAVK